MGFYLKNNIETLITDHTLETEDIPIDCELVLKDVPSSSKRTTPIVDHSKTAETNIDDLVSPHHGWWVSDDYEHHATAFAVFQNNELFPKQEENDSDELEDIHILEDDSWHKHLYSD